LRHHLRVRDYPDTDVLGAIENFYSDSIETIAARTRAVVDRGDDQALGHTANAPLDVVGRRTTPACRASGHESRALRPRS
jgi:hypothetical protein